MISRKLSRITALADYYYSRATLIKEAGLLENLAARILWSTIPARNQMEQTKALASLVPGAKELLKFGIKAAFDELSLGGENMRTNYQRAKQLVDTGNISAGLNIIKEGFETEDAWTEAYGGKPWADITQALIDLHESIRRVAKAKGQSDWNAYIKNLNEMVAYMNIVDGIAHNTGPLTEKMVRLEMAEKGVAPTDMKLHLYEEKLEKLMDAKELRNHNDVAEIALSVIKDMPEKIFPFKDWLKQKRYQQPYETSGNEVSKYDTKTELEFIRFKKANHGLFVKTRNIINNLEATSPSSYYSSLVDLRINMENFMDNLEYSGLNHLFPGLHSKIYNQVMILNNLTKQPSEKIAAFVPRALKNIKELLNILEDLGNYEEAPKEEEPNPEDKELDGLANSSATLSSTIAPFVDAGEVAFNNLKSLITLPTVEERKNAGFYKSLVSLIYNITVISDEIHVMYPEEIPTDLINILREIERLNYIFNYIISIDGTLSDSDIEQTDQLFRALAGV